MTTLDATDSTGLTLRVRFTRLTDRYAHAIFAVEPSGQEHLLLESVEGTPNDDWPPSPPLQSLSIEELSIGRRAALLVGMAGRSHWSASIEPVPGKAALAFDIACRVAAPQSVALGSTYLQPRSPDAALRSSIQMHGTDDSTACVIESQPELIFIKPGRILLSGATARWQYRVALAGNV